MRLAGTGRLFALPILKWWSQVKTAGSAIYANRHYLNLYKAKHPDRLASAVHGGSMDRRAWRRTQSANCIGRVQQQRGRREIGRNWASRSIGSNEPSANVLFRK